MLNNYTPYLAERIWTLDKDAAKFWSVVVKGTFDILPDGATKLADKQEEPLFAEEHFGEPGQSSIRYSADLVGAKVNTDIVLNGHAYSPTHRPVPEVDVSLTAAGKVKRLRVSGDRHWERSFIGGVFMSAPESFEKLPLTYERAFGGWDRNAEDPAEHRLEPRNPVGAGFVARLEHLTDTRLPNVEYPGELISSWKDRPRPAGFGVVASHWQPRLRFAGTYDDRWKQERFPLLPEDFDPRFLQCAPEDQQTAGFLRGGEKIELSNLTHGGYLAFELPRIHLGFVTRFARQKETHQAKLHTVVLEPDHPRLILVWHTSLACSTARIDYLDETLIFQKELR